MRPWQQCDPELTEVRRGWMAHTPRWHPYRIGVIGESPEQARALFTKEFEAWRLLHEQVERERGCLTV